MEKGDARLLLHTANAESMRRNIVELESHRYLHNKVNESIHIARNTNISTNAMRQELLSSSNRFGSRFTRQLVRSLQNEDAGERAAVVWLLTLLEDPQSIPHLQKLAHNPKIKRAVRLSASLALAGMGATQEVIEPPRRTLRVLSLMHTDKDRTLAQ